MSRSDSWWIILRAWMREYSQHSSTAHAHACVAVSCGVTVGRVIQVIHESTFDERQAVSRP